MEAAVNLPLMDFQRPTRTCVLEGFGKYSDSLEPAWGSLIIAPYVCALIIAEVLHRGGWGGKSPDAMCRAQHVSAKAWRFQNNLFQLVHSRAVTSIFECCRSFLALRFNATHPPGRAEVAEVEMLFRISNNEPEEGR